MHLRFLQAKRIVNGLIYYILHWWVYLMIELHSDWRITVIKLIIWFDLGSLVLKVESVALLRYSLRWTGNKFVFLSAYDTCHIFTQSLPWGQNFFSFQWVKKSQKRKVESSITQDMTTFRHIYDRVLSWLGRGREVKAHDEGQWIRHRSPCVIKKRAKNHTKKKTKYL